jgi:hypothetical protein
MSLNFATGHDTMKNMDSAATEIRCLYEISYVFPSANETEDERVPQDVREIVETQGGIVQDAQFLKKYRGFSRGFMHIIAPPSRASRIEVALRALPFPAFRALLVRWEKTAPQLRGHAFMRKPLEKHEEKPESKKEEERRAIEIDKQLDELLEKQL